MTHLYIEQNNSLTEEVNSSIISKLYELAISGNLDETSDLKGRLHSVNARDIHINYLNDNFSDLYITADNVYITFADPIIDLVLTEYLGDGNGVKAADITTTIYLNGVFASDVYNRNTNSDKNFSVILNTIDKTQITSFNEFLQFTNVTSIGYWPFTNWTNLESIVLPSSVTTIQQYAFENCKKLGTINIENVTSFSDNCFSGCTLLDNVTLNSSLTSIVNRMFAKCTSLSSIDLSNIQSVRNNAFEQCIGLHSIISIQNVTHIGSDSFIGCKNIQEFLTLNLPNLRTKSYDSDGAFAGCTLILHVTNLGTISLIGGLWLGTFQNCTNLLDAILPETITTMGYCCFGGCSSLRYVKVLSTQVPTYDTKNGFNNVQSYGRFFGENYTNNNPVTDTYDGLTFPIYVKDELLSQYQSADYWKYVGPNRLRPLSQFATDFPNG